MTQQINFFEILETARLAPSVHNTQPWRVACRGKTIDVRLDAQHVLTDGDPTRRQTIISLGIFCEAIKVSAEGLGYRVDDIRQSSDGAIIHLGPTTIPPSPEAARYGELLAVRHSDRSVYHRTDIDEAAIRDIEKAADNHVKVWVSTDPALIAKVADLTSRGISVALSSPGFRKELSRYLILPWSRKKRGISVKSLYIAPLIAYLQPWLVRFGIGIGKEVRLERKRWESASAVVLITAKGDFGPYWFEAGRVYLRASLEVAGLGLAQATSAAVVEASNYHVDIENMLGTEQRMLALMRIGGGSSKHHYSPRLSVSELTSS